MRHQDWVMEPQAPRGHRIRNIHLENPFGRTFFIINEFNNNEDNYMLFNDPETDSLNETKCGSSVNSHTESNHESLHLTFSMENDQPGAHNGTASPHNSSENEITLSDDTCSEDSNLINIDIDQP